VAGPAAGVLLPDAWTRGDVEELHGWLPPTQSITVEVGAPEYDDPDEAAHLKRALGYLPGTEIVLSAALNGPEDHRLLARLAIVIARRYDGRIDLDGLVAARSDDDRWLRVPYRTARGQAAAYHVVDAEQLTEWLEHPRFRMVK
jgi:hypothetical protein